MLVDSYYIDVVWVATPKQSYKIKSTNSHTCARTIFYLASGWERRSLEVDNYL